MIDLDDLIAEADKAYEDIFNVAKRERDLIRRLADALESVRAERDAAVAALDGAPEPEAGQLPETGQEKRDEDGDLISSGEHRKVLHQGGYVCDSCVNVLGLNVRWDHADRMEGHPLPVEGESRL